MSTRKLGHFDIEPVGLGCMGLSQSYYPMPTKQEGIELLQKSHAYGYNFYDTADMYGKNQNEILVGEGLRDIRDEVVIATKFGFKWMPDGSILFDGSPEYCKSCCDASLERLGIEQIDLYYMHRLDPNVPIEESVGAMAELVEEGKVKYIGLSEVSSETIRRAHAVHPITAVQSEYSLFSLDVERDVLDTCKELGITFVAFSPLGRGFLTGTLKSYDDFDENDSRRNIPRFSPENFDKNLQLVHVMQEIADEKNCTLAQLALAWVLAQGDHIVVIPGTTKEKYMMQNFDAKDVVLTEDDLAKIRSKIEEIEIIGHRYFPSAISLLDNELKE
eukprot:TRINITY_DN10544_c0_g1_i1.p1 TRINITY_DN10544_c0_g1~~TRINITY_DN10544_c0_g1_i1.p1  ORF type:complete len:331 (-),score=68.42 TRINITY_DN10544_c0_g1_i1:2-994(-)